MKNERCLIKKIMKIKEKIVKICVLFLVITCLCGFYKETNLYVNLEEITMELGDIFPNKEISQINNYLNNSNFFLESNLPVNENGEITDIGTFNYYIVYRDEERKYSRLTNKRSTITVNDTIKPEIKLKESSLTFEYGSVIKATDVAECFDLSVCMLSFNEDIDTEKSGVHEVLVIAIDEGNNTSEISVSITIKEKPKPVYRSYFNYSDTFSEMNNHNNNLNSGLSENEKSARRYALAEFAKQFNGNPYVYGGTSLTNGVDCSGFVMAIYANYGYKMPRTAGDQGYMGKQVGGSELLPGDIIVYHDSYVGNHTGIYIGDGLMIHAANSNTGIVIVPMYDGYRTYNRIIY